MQSKSFAYLPYFQRTEILKKVSCQHHGSTIIDYQLEPPTYRVFQFEAYVEATGIKMNVEDAQKTALLGSARILRLVLGQYRKRRKKCDSLGSR